MSTYAEKLKDPRWQKRRLEILQRDGFACRLCASGDKTLHVHHHYYVQGRNPWNYPNFALLTLCKDCHEDTQRSMRDISNDGVDELFEWEDALDVFGLDSPEMPVLILQFTEMCKRNNTTPVKLLSNLSEEFFAAKP